MRCVWCAAFCGLVGLLGNPLVAAHDPEPSNKRETAPGDGLRRHVAHLEARLDSQLKLLADGLTCEHDVDRIRASLAKSKHDLALSEGNQEGVAEQCRVLLEIRERQWQRFRSLHDAGAGYQRQTVEAERRVAVVRYLVAKREGRHGAALDELKRAVELCKAEVKWWEKKATDRLVYRSDLNRARCRMICCAYLQAKAGARSEDIIPQLRDAVEMWEREWEQVRQLYDQRTVTVFDKYFVHSYLLDTKLRLASAEKKPEAVSKLLRDLVQLHETVLERGRTWGWIPYLSPSANKNLEMSVVARLRRDTQRLQEFEGTGSLRDDLTVAELDP